VPESQWYVDTPLAVARQQGLDYRNRVSSTKPAQSLSTGVCAWKDGKGATDEVHPNSTILYHINQFYKKKT
jgi:hypothetical protein